VDDKTRRKLRVFVTGFFGLWGFRPPPDPEAIAAMMPGPDLSGASPEPMHSENPEVPNTMAAAPRRKLGAVVNGMELDVELSTRGKNHVWRDPARKPPEL
jgi:hypothetical protein